MRVLHDLWTSPFLQVLLYYVPLLLCVYGYAIRTWRNYQKDVQARELAEAIDDVTRRPHYYPTDTIGTIIGRGLVTVIPVANLFAATFDVGPKVFSSFFGWIRDVVDQPIVPKRR